MKTLLSESAQPTLEKEQTLNRKVTITAPVFIALLILALFAASTGAQPGTAMAKSKPDNRLPGLAQSEWGVATPARVRDFAPLGSRSGWLLVENRLYRSEDGGSSWIEITPPGALELAAAHFLDPQHGWAILNPGLPGEMGSLPVDLAVTQDGGATWQVSPVVLQGDGEPRPPAAYSLEFVDPQAGWLVAKQASSSNFSAGSLFRTLDGGLTWQRLETPLGEAVHFIDRQVGYTWRAESGEAYRTLDGGTTWQAVDMAEISPPVLGGAEIRSPQGSLISLSQDKPEVRISAGDPQVAWALQREGSCEAGPTQEAGLCSQAQSLLATEDGGQSWRAINLPVSIQEIFPAPLDQAPQPAAPVPLATGHGIDKCEVPSLANLQEWMNASPYRAVNLYIGGSMRACSNSALNANYVAQIDRQGWTTIPTWVGPQAACTGFRVRMSYDPNEAYDQGVQEAIDAVETAGKLGLWGQVIYYDLEAFNTSDSACLKAARSFINGWTYGLHWHGYVAGVYGSPCSSGLKDFYTLADKPEAVWIAHWIYSAYNPAATVWNVVCMDNTYWPNHQRIRQYAGGHAETWGTVTMTIDSNVLDGVIAQAYGQPHQVCPRVSAPANAGVIFYNKADYDCAGRQANYGYVWQWNSGLYNINSFFSNRASSIYIPSGWSVRVYDGADGGGGKACLEAPGDANFSGNVFDNGTSMDDTISSYQVFKSTGCKTTAAPDSPGETAGDFLAAPPELAYPEPGLFESPQRTSGAGAALDEPPLPTREGPGEGQASPAAPSADTQPPTVAFTSHATRGYINAAQAAAPITLQANITDGGSGVSHAQFFTGYDDGSGWKWYPLGWDTNAADGWSMSWNPSAAPDQAAVGMYAAAWDVEGNVSGQSLRHITLDRLFPGSALQALPANLDTTVIRLNWTGADPAASNGSASGLARFDLQVQVDGGAWQDWQTGLPPSQSSATYYGQLGHSYAFRMRAADKAGNQEAYPGGAETATTINTCVGDSYEADNSSGAAKPLALNAPQNHTLCGLGDQDWLSFNASAGQFYQFRTTALGSDSDTVLTLYASNGTTVLAQNDNVEPGLQSSLLWQAQANGVVYLRVTHADSRVAGNAVTYQVVAETPLRTYVPLLYR